MLQRANLIIYAPDGSNLMPCNSRFTATACARSRKGGVTTVSIQLQSIKRQWRPSRWIVAAQTFRATGEIPYLVATSARNARVRDLVNVLRACGINERGIALVVIPLVIVSVPGSTIV